MDMFSLFAETYKVDTTSTRINLNYAIIARNYLYSFLQYI